MLSVRIFLVSIAAAGVAAAGAGHAQDTQPSTVPSPQSAATRPRLQFMGEVGLRSFEGSPWKEIARFVADEIAQVDHPYTRLFREARSKVDPACLPIRARFFASSGATDTACFLVVVDSDTALDLAWIRTKIGLGLEPVEGLQNTWKHESGFLLCQSRTVDGRHRILVSNFDIAQAKQESFELPKPGRPQRRILSELRTARCYVLLDIAGPPTVMAIRETHGRPTIDVVYGLSGATGALALFLPREPGEARLLGSPPFEPDVMGLLDLGPSTQRTVEAALGILAARKDAPPWAARAREVARCWTGTAGLYAQVVGEKLRGGLVLGIEKDSEEETTPAAEGILRLLRESSERKAEPVAPDMGPGQKVKWERGCSKVEAKDGLLIWSLGPDEEYCRNFVDKVRAKQGEHTLPERLRTANGPLQILVKARLWRQFRQLHDEATKDEDEAEAGGPYAQGQRLARRIREKGLDFIKDDVVMSATWDRHWLRLRIQF